MTDKPESAVPSVNPDTTEIADSEASKEAWVDPIFKEQNPERLPDEGEAPAGDAAPADSEANEPTQEQLKALIEKADQAEKDDGKATPAEGDEAEKKATEAEAEKAKKAEGDEEGEEGEEGEKPPAEAGEKKPRRRRSRSRRERRESERRIVQLEAQVQALTDTVEADKPAKDAEEAPGEEVPAGPPKLEDFDFDTDEWAAAFSTWTQKQISAGTMKAEKAKADELLRVEDERRQEVMKVFGDREDEARTRHNDYDDKVYDETITIPEAAAAIIWEAETGPEIAYYLATHQDEAARLGELTDVQVAREVGRIEARLMAEQAPAAKPAADDNDDDPDTPAEKAEPDTPAAAAEKAPEPESRPQARPSATQAPEPIIPIAAGAVTHRDPGKMSMEEYGAGRRSGKIR